MPDGVHQLLALFPRHDCGSERTNWCGDMSLAGLAEVCCVVVVQVQHEALTRQRRRNKSGLEAGNNGFLGTGTGVRGPEKERLL